MRLRDYTAADLEVVHAINQAEVPAVGDETREALGRIGELSTIALVAEDDDGVVGGFCMVLEPGTEYESGNYRWFEDRYDSFVYLDRVAIAPAFQRQGLGRRFYDEVERLAAERCPDAEHFTLEVNLRPRNDTSLAFHAALGFVEVGQRETSYGALVSMMAKPL
ncbi:MAG: GNAT family N-acetyltransferase [Acidimicrobiaceae bacterium]|nr:GNAT family N-acetyltransferase [Acidimicrobiaceae bacterium]